MGSQFKNNRHTKQPNSPAIHLVSQVTLRCESKDRDSKKLFTEMRRDCLEWVAHKTKGELPPHAWEGENFQIDDAVAQPVSGTSLTKPSIWSCKFRDADKTVPQRSWVIELCLAINGNEVIFGCRLQAISFKTSTSYLASIPKIVIHIAEKYNATIDKRPAKSSPWVVNENADELLDFLLSPERSKPVIVLSRTIGDDKEEKTLASEEAILERLCGIAHIVTISTKVASELTEKLGKEFSVFNGSVRTYNKMFRPEQDSAYSHPLATNRRIENWYDEQQIQFEDFLVDRVIRKSSSANNLFDELPAFSEIHALSQSERHKEALKRGASQKELLELSQAENISMKEQISSLKEENEWLLSTSSEEIRTLEDRLNTSRKQFNSIKYRAEYLEQALKSSNKDSSPDTPDSFENIEEWCEKHLSGRVLVMPRALRAAKKSHFQDPSLAYKALLALRDFYSPMKRIGGIELAENYRSHLLSLNLEETPTFHGSGAGEFGDEYYITYNGSKLLLDKHLKGSNCRDERFGFRLYFCWDSENEQIVVGSFPSHLTTRAS